MRTVFTYFYLTVFFLLLHAEAQAQANPQADSLKREILNLQLELDHTQNDLQLYSRDFKRGILTSVIGYSIVITGGVLLGTDNLSEWGQPLIFSGGLVGAAGGVFLFRSHRHLENTDNLPPLLEP